MDKQIPKLSRSVKIALREIAASGGRAKAANMTPEQLKKLGSDLAKARAAKRKARIGQLKGTAHK